MNPAQPPLSGQPPLWRNFWFLAGAVTAVKILTLIFTPLGLGPDEAQYWYWSRDLDFGYFSKPPLIAWAIALPTALFGNVDWSARLPAPLFHLGAAGFLYFTAKRLYGERVAFWAGLGWLFMPGVVLSSFIIATDAPLLFFWSGALFFLIRIVDADRPALADFAWLGAMVGFGMLSKYAMIYFPVALALCVVASPLRARLLRIEMLAAALIALLLFTPNIIWNAQHEFQTLSHTAANAQWNTNLFKPLNLLEFLGGQFAVFGIISFAALIWIAIDRKRWPLDDKDRLLLIFALAPLLIVAGQAFLSRAHANWAAAAYPAAMLLITGLLIRRNHERLIKASMALHLALFVVFTAGVLSIALIDASGFSRAVKDLRGWKEQTDDIMAHAPGYDAVLIDDRYLMGEMLFHQQDSAIEIAAIDVNASIDNHFEAFRGFDPSRMKRVLFVTSRDDAAHVDYRFAAIMPIGVVEAAPGKGLLRRYRLYELSGYFGPGAD